MFCRANAAVVGVLKCFQRFEVSALNPKTVPESVLELSGGSAALSRSKPALPGTSQPSRRFSSNVKMPKKEKAVRGRAAAAGGATETSGPVARDKGGALTITVRAKPGSQRSGIADVSPEAVGVSIAAPPADGEANAELIRYLAEVLDLKKTHVSLEKGSRSRDKLVRVDCSLSPEEVLDRLRQAAG